MTHNPHVHEINAQELPEEGRSRRRKKFIIFALLVSPCHSFLIGPILASILSGTAAGAFLATNNILLGVFFAFIFLIGVLIIFRRQKGFSSLPT